MTQQGIHFIHSWIYFKVALNVAIFDYLFPHKNAIILECTKIALLIENFSESTVLQHPQ